MDTLDHLPPLPLFIDYSDETGLGFMGLKTPTVSSEDELGIYHALRLHDRVRRIELRVSPPTLDKYLRVMDEPFPILEHLSLSMPITSVFSDSYTRDSVTPLTPFNVFLAPNLRHLSLQNIHLPKRLRLLSSTLSLVTLKLTNIQASGYIHPRLLVARLESLLQLEELSIEFLIPIPRPSAEMLLLGKQGTPVILSNLKFLTFRGVSAYLERLISQIRAPVLRILNVGLFNQLAFTLTHLSQFVNNTEQIKFPRTATIKFIFGGSIILGPCERFTRRGYEGFTLYVMCRPLDWQVDCAAQICSALMSTLSGIESLTLQNINRLAPSDLGTYETDHTIYDITWLELLRSFVGVKELHMNHYFSVELSRALEVEEIGLDPGLLPDLQELVGESRGQHADGLFGSFIHARQVAGRPVSLRLTPPPLPIRA